MDIGRRDTSFTTLFGRDEVSRQIEAEVRMKRPVLIVGDAGIGKSALARSLARRMDGIYVDLEGVEALGAMLVRIERALGLSVGATNARSLGVALHSVLSARQIPLFIDSIDTLDSAASEFLSTISGCTVITFARARRPVSSSTALLSLGGLDRESGAALLLSSLFNQNESEDVMASISERLGGNPQSLRLAAARVLRYGASAVVQELGEGNRSLQWLLRDTFERLSPRAKRVVVATSVFVASAEAEALGYIAKVDEGEIQFALHEATEAALLRVRTAGRATRYSTSEAVREMVGAEARSEYEGRAKEYMMKRLPEETRKFSSRKRTESKVWIEEEELNITTLADRAEATDAMSMLLPLTAWTKAYGLAEELLMTLRSLASRAELSSANAANLALATAELLESIGDRAEAIAAADEAVCLARTCESARVESQALALLGLLSGNTALAERALKLAREKKDVPSSAVAFARLASTLAEQKSTSLHAFFPQAIAFIDLHGDPYAAAKLRSARGAELTDQRAYTEAERLLLRAKESLSAMGMSRAWSLNELRLGMLYQELGKFDAAEACFLSVISNSDSRGQSNYESEAYLRLGMLALDTGRSDAATSHFEQCIRTAGDGHLVRKAKAGLDAAMDWARNPLARAAEPNTAEDRIVNRIVERFSPTADGGGVGSDAVRFDDEIRWVERAGTRYIVPGNGPLRTLLKVLLESRKQEPGKVVPRQALFAAAWGEEVRIAPKSMNNRVNVTIANLRKCGLSGILESGPGGYYLSPEVSVETQSA